MQFVLMRHATRASSFDNDCPLSAVGHAQAAHASSVLAPKGVLPKPSVIFSSPKLRARQTVAHLARHLDYEVKCDDRLDERDSHESRQLFEARIQSFIASATASITSSAIHHRGAATQAEMTTPPDSDSQNLNRVIVHESVTLACSHMDWLESVLTLIPTNLSELEMATPWAAGEFRVFDISNDGLWTLIGQGILPTHAGSHRS